MKPKNIEDVVAARVEEFDKKFDVETSGRDGNEYFSSCHACELSPFEMKKWLTTTITQLVKEEREGNTDPILCNRKGIHTCRVDAIHVPEHFCGKLSKLITPPTSDVIEK